MLLRSGPHSGGIGCICNGLLSFCCDGCIVAVPAERFILVFLSKDHQGVAGDKSVGMVCRASALHADRMDLLDILGDCHESRHRTERLAHEVCVETGNDDSDASVGEGLYDINESLVKELCLINAYDFNIA